MSPAADIMAQLPLLPDSVKPLGDTVPKGWWDNMPDCLPVVAVPQLNQELAELVRFARDHGVRLVPIGSGSFRFWGDCYTPKQVLSAPTLLVQPGHTTVWSGPDTVNQSAWIPAGFTITEAEAALNEFHYTLSPWPQDQGTIGGNWIVPRGSFSTREYLAPAQRRLGIEAIFGHGEWMIQREVPRSAAGPNVARFLAASAGAAGLITRVRIAVRPLRSIRRATGQAGKVEQVFDEIRAAVMQDHFPTALTLTSQAEHTRIDLEQRIATSWDEHTFVELCRRLQLKETETLETPPTCSLLPQQRTWRELDTMATDGALPRLLAGPTPSGMVEFIDAPAKPPQWWADWMMPVVGQNATQGLSG